MLRVVKILLVLSLLVVAMVVPVAAAGPGGTGVGVGTGCGPYGPYWTYYYAGPYGPYKAAGTGGNVAYQGGPNYYASYGPNVCVP